MEQVHKTAGFKSVENGNALPVMRACDVTEEDLSLEEITALFKIWTTVLDDDSDDGDCQSTGINAFKFAFDPNPSYATSSEGQSPTHLLHFDSPPLTLLSDTDDFVMVQSLEALDVDTSHPDVSAIVNTNLLGQNREVKKSGTSKSSERRLRPPRPRRHRKQSEHHNKSITLWGCPAPRCNQVFTRRHDFKRHYLIHSGKRPYRCEVCNEGWRRSEHLKSHLL